MNTTYGYPIINIMTDEEKIIRLYALKDLVPELRELIYRKTILLEIDELINQRWYNFDLVTTRDILEIDTHFDIGSDINFYDIDLND